jgi:hypothetical protein
MLRGYGTTSLQNLQAARLPQRGSPMRRHFVVKRKEPLFADQAPQPKHAPLLPMLQEIAFHKQMRLLEDLTDRAWSSPQCLLNWTTSKGIACRFYLIGGPGDYRVDLFCWGGNRVVARKQWASRSLNAANEIKQLIESVHTWAETLD